MKSDIKTFIDFFHNASLKIRKERPVFIRGKDGNLVKLALAKLSETQLEMLAVWFLAKKPKLKAAIGAMLSRAVLEELTRKIKDPGFWKELDDIYEKNFYRQAIFDNISENKKTFTERELIGLLSQNDHTKRK